jgi:hypothetical protein
MIPMTHERTHPHAPIREARRSFFPKTVEKTPLSAKKTKDSKKSFIII